MAFTEDLDIFFDLDGFAVNATLNGDTFAVILDTPTNDFDGYEASVEAGHFSFVCKNTDLTGANARRKDSVVVDGSYYKIAAIRDEGQGTSRVYLKTDYATGEIITFGGAALTFGGENLTIGA